MTGAHSSGNTAFAQIDAKILSNNMRTTSSEQPFDDLNSQNQVTKTLNPSDSAGEREDPQY